MPDSVAYARPEERVIMVRLIILGVSIDLDLVVATKACTCQEEASQRQVFDIDSLYIVSHLSRKFA